MATNGNGNRPKKPPKTEQPPAAVDPWERQPAEGDERWAAFLIYREQLATGEPRRSLAKVARELGKSKQLIERWSSDDAWTKRVEAYDREQDAIRRAAQVKEMEAMVRRQGTSLSAAAQALLAPIQAFLKKLQEARKDGGDPYEGYDLRELMREAREAAKLLPNLIQAERLVAGLSTQNHGGHDGGPIDVRVEEARRRARAMSRSELEETLLGEQLDPASPTQN